MTKVREAIERIERSPHHPGLLLLAFLALVVGRNLLEGALGPSGSIGFVYFAGPSALMVLDHFLFFYVSLFLALSILLSLLSGETLGAVMKVMTPMWVVVLIPPVVDWLVSGGEGIGLSYLLDFRSVVFRFFNPAVALERVSPGQRVEVVAAMALAAVYVVIKGRGWLRAAVSFIAVYLLILLHAVLPNALARLIWALSGNPDAPGSLIYNAMYKAGGIVPDESRKLALVFLMTSLGFGFWAYERFARSEARAALSNLRPLRSLHYLGMAAFGVALGWVFFAPVGVRFTGGGDILGLAGVLLSVFLAFQSAVWLNDLYDEESDRLAGAGQRPLVRGALTRADAAVLAGVLAAAALLFALNVKYSTFLFVLLALALSMAYSAPPLRLKRIPLISNLSLGVITLLACLAGFSAYAEERTLALFPPQVGWVLLLAFGLGFAAKDMKDRLGDGATGVVTLPVLLGERAGRVATAVLVLIGYLVVPVFLPYPVLTIPAVVLGLASAAAVLWWAHPKLDLILLAVCLAFTLVVGLVVVTGVEAVMPSHVPRVAVHGAQGAALIGRHAAAWNDWPRAAESYSHAASVLMGDARLHEKAGNALYRAGWHDEALPYLLAAVDLDPSRPVALQDLALTEARLGRTDASNELMRDAVRRGMRPRVFLSLLGDEAGRRGEHELAIESFTLALRAGQPDIPARLRLGEALLASGRVDEARRELSTAVRRRPSSAEAHDALGRFHNIVGEPAPAAEAFAEATRLGPEEPVFWNNLGVALREGGRLEEAFGAFDEATRLAPSMPDPYWNRGLILARLGRFEEARHQYVLALEANPEFMPARQALAALPPASASS